MTTALPPLKRPIVAESTRGLRIHLSQQRVYTDSTSAYEQGSTPLQLVMLIEAEILLFRDLSHES